MRRGATSSWQAPSGTSTPPSARGALRGSTTPLGIRSASLGGSRRLSAALGGSRRLSASPRAWHLLGRPQVGEEVGGALLLAARRREGLPKELRPRTPPRPAVLRVVLGDEEVASAAQLPRPRAASAAPHLHAHAVGPLASPRLQRERAPVAHRVDDEPAVQRPALARPALAEGERGAVRVDAHLEDKRRNVAPRSY